MYHLLMFVMNGDFAEGNAQYVAHESYNATKGTVADQRQTQYHLAKPLLGHWKIKQQRVIGSSGGKSNFKNGKDFILLPIDALAAEVVLFLCLRSINRRETSLSVTGDSSFAIKHYLSFKVCGPAGKKTIKLHLPSHHLFVTFRDTLSLKLMVYFYNSEHCSDFGSCFSCLEIRKYPGNIIFQSSMQQE